MTNETDYGVYEHPVTPVGRADPSPPTDDAFPVAILWLPYPDRVLWVQYKVKRAAAEPIKQRTGF